MQQHPYGTFEFDLARRWAPLHWQGVHRAADLRNDLVSAVNFDGNWTTIGNWDAMADHALLPVVYFSVVESGTHWFLLYAFYHPRDWATGIGEIYDQHENDMEGLLLIVERPGGLGPEVQYGQILGMITLAHNHFYSYSNVLQGNRENLDGPLFLSGESSEVLRPCSRQEAQGHGCYGLQPTDTRAWRDLGKPLKIDPEVARRAFEFPEGQGVRYFPGDQADEPPASGSVTTSDSPYILEDIFDPAGFWQQKCGPPEAPFTPDWKRIAGRKHGKDKASPPWSWDDKDDASSMSVGMIATDPARLARHYLSGFATFSHEYVHNPYTQPLVCPGGTAGPPLAMRAGSAAGAGSRSRPMSGTALRRELRLAADPSVRQEIAIALLQEARRSDDFRRDLSSAASATLETATNPRTRRTQGPDAAERLHLAIPAIRALGQLEVRGSRPKLVQLLEATTDRDVLLAALESLSQLAPGNVRGLKKALTGLLTCGDPQVRAAAARLYAEVMARRDPEPLAALVSDTNSDVRAAALDGLGRSGRPIYRRDLKHAAEDSEEKTYVRVVAERALMRGRSGRSRRRYARERGLDVGLAEATPTGRRPESAVLTETPTNADQYGRFCLARDLEE